MKTPATDAQIKAGLQKLLERHASQLAEHFAAVQIVASAPNSDGGTSRFAAGEGDWYARLGLANSFGKSNEADEFAWKLVQMMPKGGGG